MRKTEIKPDRELMQALYDKLDTYPKIGQQVKLTGTIYAERIYQPGIGERWAFYTQMY